MKAYQVTAKCGHVGKNYYAVKDFPVIAEDGKDAARLTRYFPRVKHHQKDAILDVVEITWEEYNALVLKNKQDPYFHCSNVQEQRMYEEVVYSEIVEEKTKSSISNKIIYHGKEIIRNPKKYFRNICYKEMYAI